MLWQSKENHRFQWYVSLLVGCLQFRGLDYRGVCNSGVWIIGVSAIQGSGLEGCLHFRGRD